jgi:hypothetical protein
MITVGRKQAVFYTGTPENFRNIQECEEDTIHEISYGDVSVTFLRYLKPP